MKPYTVLLVDDEQDVMQVMQTRVPWGEIGFSVVGTAANGVKALELIEQYQPDVVLTDIQMPYMNGLELIEQAKDLYPATRFVIFTGFDEFEYAKTAIRLAVGDYLLKPASAAELTATFKQIKVKLDEAVAASHDVASLRRYYQESLPLMQANFFAGLLDGRIDAASLAQYQANYQLNLTGPYYCCVVIHTSSTQLPEGMDHLLLATSVQQQAHGYFHEQWAVNCINYLGNTVMVVQLPDQAAIAGLTDAADAFCKSVHRLLGAVVTIGIGQVSDQLVEMAHSYTGARMAVTYRSVYGDSRVINIKEVAPKEMTRFAPQNDAELAELFKKVHLGNEAGVRQAVDHYLHHMEQTATSIAQHTVVVSELIGSLYRFAATNHLNVPALTENVKHLYQWLPDLEPQSLRTWLLDVSVELAKQLDSARNCSTNALIAQAQEYVVHHYQDAELSLDFLCRELGVSKSYFSTIFKRETGKAFVAYLTDYRMDWAARLLVETNEKSHVIGKMVGYSDPNYFSYVFKRRFGCSPLKYRSGLVSV